MINASNSPLRQMLRYGRQAATAVAVIAIGGISVLHFTPSQAGEARQIPAPTVDEKPGSGNETIALAGGCFWGVQGVFQHVNGVISATSGYAGGKKSTAEYETVSTGTTGHAETVNVVFDPQKISLGHLLQIYFSVAHDPTEVNMQGPDSGTQYRSAIFPTSAEQARVAQAYIDQLNSSRVFHQPIATRIEPEKQFFPAEGYHQNFLTNHPTYPYIAINDMPKIDDLKRLFPKEYRADPVLVAAKAN